MGFYTQQQKRLSTTENTQSKARFTRVRNRGPVVFWKTQASEQDRLGFNSQFTLALAARPCAGLEVIHEKNLAQCMAHSEHLMTGRD